MITGLTKLRAILIFLICSTPILCNAEEFGNLCLAPVEPSNSAPKSLSNPSGGQRSFNFQVQLDNRAPVKILSNAAIDIKDLAAGQTHLVRIFKDGKQIESFQLKFSDYKARNLCLSFKKLYETWSITDVAVEKNCKCTFGYQK